MGEYASSCRCVGERLRFLDPASKISGSTKLGLEGRAVLAKPPFNDANMTPFDFGRSLDMYYTLKQEMNSIALCTKCPALINACYTSLNL